MMGRGTIFSVSAALLVAASGCGAAVMPVASAPVATSANAGRVHPATDPTSPSQGMSPAHLPVPNRTETGTGPGPTPLWTQRVRSTDTDIFPRPAWVAVPVVTLWNQPGFARPVDAGVTQAQPVVGQWVSSMDYQQKVDLDNRMATQALLDDPLTVLGLEGDWAHVLVNDQKGSVYTEGIDGWLPRSQITFTPLHASTVTATVSVPFAPAGDLVLSYGTRLPVVGSAPGQLVVETAKGVVRVPEADVRTTPPPGGGEAVVAQTKQFLGLPYLWAGTSAYGFDCSGLTYAIYRQFGITLARDAADQAQQGTSVPKTQLRPGDLLFFASAGLVHHVSVYAGNGMMLDAPETGGRVELVPLWTSYLSAQYAGARRYLG